MKTAILFICGVYIYLAILKPAWGHCKVSQNVECFCDGVGTAAGGCCRKTGYLVTGLKNSIPDEQITASSVFHVAGFEPPKSRIDNVAGQGVWLQANGKTDQWIQFDLGKPWTIMGFVTKGRYSSDQWVTSYDVKYAITTDDYNAGDWNLAIYNPAPELGTTSIFPGNHDRTTPHVNWLLKPIRAQYIRIYPKTFNGYRSLRADIIGCFDYE